VWVQLGSTFRPHNSLLVSNTTVPPAFPDCARSNTATVSSLGRNLVGVAGNCAFVASDLVGAAANLGPFTAKARVASGHFPLLPGSAALDAADPAGCPARDQLGQGRQGPCDIGAAERVPTTDLVFSALPISRTGEPGFDLTFFFTAINAGAATAYRVGLDALTPLVTGAAGAELAVTGVPATFTYQTTDATNALTGTIETPVDIAPGGIQSYLLVLRPSAPFDPVELALGVDGPNALPAAPIPGVSTILVSADDPKPADVVALAAAPGGIVDLAPVAAVASEVTRAGAFAVATVNLGAGGPITVTADTGAAALPLAVFLCQTDPGTGQCLGGGLVPSLTVDIATNATPTFAFFPTTEAEIPFDPAVNRIFVRFTDAGGVVRGGTSVAIRTL
jgi:hypothetical protein